MSNRSTLTAYLPESAKRWVNARRLRSMRSRNSRRSVEDVFADVYANGRWGGGGPGFNSGTGSRGEAAECYAAYVRELLDINGPLCVVDVGCGDFEVASAFVDSAYEYIGLDVVPALIERNRALYGSDSVDFRRLDASTADLPEGDLCLIRQVLQHLSNDQIDRILWQCRHFPAVLITEHWPAPELATEPNADKPHGPDTRLDSGSWVDIRQVPFSLRYVTEVLCVPAPSPLYSTGETIRTFLWRPYG
jgi:SAM-dependent methyltransferase